MENYNAIVDKSKRFALRIIKLYRYLCGEYHEFDLFRQLLRSGTSIGANIKEAIRAQSKPDFISKMSIALKEASESEYWIELFHEADYINDREYVSINADIQELIKLLTSIIKTSKINIQLNQQNI